MNHESLHLLFESGIPQRLIDDILDLPRVCPTVLPSSSVERRQESLPAEIPRPHEIVPVTNGVPVPDSWDFVVWPLAKKHHLVQRNLPASTIIYI